MRKPDLNYIREEFRDRISSVKTLLDSLESHENDDPEGAPLADVSTVERNIKGLVIVMLFGSYERLMHRLSQELIDTANSFRGKRKNLTAHFRMIGLAPLVCNADHLKKKTIWDATLPKMIKELEGDAAGLDVATWPDNGEFMKAAHFRLICSVFRLDSAKSALGRVNGDIDMIVVNRNKIAHGEYSPADVGRDYTLKDMRELVNHWESGWCQFLDKVESIVSERSYFVEQ